jgi:hypothetical protein
MEYPRDYHTRTGQAKMTYPWTPRGRDGAGRETWSRTTHAGTLLIVKRSPRAYDLFHLIGARRVPMLAGMLSLEAAKAGAERVVWGQ